MMPSVSRTFAIALLIVPLNMAYGGVTAVGASEAVPACPAPKVDSARWTEVSLQALGIRFKIPPKYKEQSAAVRIGRNQVVSYSGGPIDHIDLEASSGSETAIPKVVRQPYYQDYSECSETVDGHQLNIQSFRGGGTVFLSGTATMMYEVMAFYQVSPGRFVRITSGFATRQSQEEMLGLLRTIKRVE